ALSIAEKTQGPEHPSVGTALNDLAEIYRGLGRAAEAEALLKRSVDIREKARAAQLSGGSGTEDPAYMLSQANELYRAGKYAEAIPLAERYAQIIEARHDKEGRSTGLHLTTLANSIGSPTDLARPSP